MDYDSLSDTELKKIIAEDMIALIQYKPKIIKKKNPHSVSDAAANIASFYIAKMFKRRVIRLDIEADFLKMQSFSMDRWFQSFGRKALLRSLNRLVYYYTEILIKGEQNGN